MDKILSFYKDARVLERGGMVFPRMVSVWLTHYCNLSCGYCLYSRINGEKRCIDTEKMYRLIDELSSLGVESLEFSGGGEPTIHKECYHFAEYAANKGMKLGMFTNAAVLDLGRTKFFKYIRVGVDKLDSESFVKLKGSTEEYYEKLIIKLASMVERKKKEKREFPRIGMKFMVGEGNRIDMLSESVQFARLIGVDYVSFRRVYGEGGIPEKKVESFVDELHRLKERYGSFITGEFMFENLKEPCFLAPIYAVINAEGNLLNCCYANKPEQVIGNVLEDGFEMVWNSDKHREVLSSLSPSLCNKFTCRWRFYNNAMREFMKDESELSFI